MQWVDLVTTIDLAAVIILGILFISTVIKKEKSLFEKLLAVLLFFQCSWIALDGLAVFLAVHFGLISELHGSFIGLAQIGIILSVMLLCEFFPERETLPGFRTRIVGWSISAIPLAIIVFTPYWVYGRRVVDGIKVAQHGPGFYGHAIWIVLVLTSSMLVLFLKSRRTRNLRATLNMRFLLVAILANLGLALITTFVLPLLGIFEFDFIGPVVSVIFIAGVLYTVNFYSLFDIQRATIRFLMKLIACAVLCAVVFFAVEQIAIGHRLASYILEFGLLWMGYVLYANHLQPRFDRLLTGEEPRQDGILLKLLLGRLPGSEGTSLQRLLDSILSALTEALHIQGGMIIAQDRFRSTCVSDRFASETPVAPGLARLLIRVSKTDLSEAFLRAFDGVFLLEQNNRDQDSLNTTGLLRYLRKYPRIARMTIVYLARLRDVGVQLIIPLVLERRLLGLLFLGAPGGSRPYYAREIGFLRNVRATIALAIRNHNNQQELIAIKNHAEAEVEKLTDYITQEPGQQNIRGRVMVYRSRIMSEALEQARRVSSVRGQAILITGETGTGKELIARFIHENREPDAPFVAVNCAAVPETLWESEIFGYQKGAFTDARQSRAGRVEEARQGTLLFDEIGEMPLHMQTRLLRLLQERTYTPLGASGERPAECDFIFATNRDLAKMVAAGTFREDLFFRINVLQVSLPPLRERPEDVPVLVRHFIEQMSSKLGCVVERIDETAIEDLMRYPWSGNVRELENVMIRIMAGAGSLVIDRMALPPLVRAGPGPQAWPAGENRNDIAEPILHGNYRELVTAYRTSLIRSALKQSQGNRTHAAGFLGLNRTTLTAQIAELEIDADQFKTK